MLRLDYLAVHRDRLEALAGRLRLLALGGLIAHGRGILEYLRMSETNPEPATDEHSAPGAPLHELPSFSTGPWQMSFGERAVIEGILTQLKPRLALEIGTAEGGSLARLAAHSEKVISFDLVEPQLDMGELPNVELRTGDSHALLAAELEHLAAIGESIDFVLIDGDHSAEGARRDMEDVLASDAVTRAVVLAHDTLNQEVRAGLEAVPFADIDKVAFVDLDFVGGYVPAEPPIRGECWGGLGLVVVDDSFGRAHAGNRATMVPLPQLVWPTAASMLDEVNRVPGIREDSAEADDLTRYRRLVEEMQDSLSWRLTAPLRSTSQRLRRR